MAETSRGASQENPPPAQSSIVQISSIYIELPFPPPPMNGEGCCSHNFSMRAFTVGKRGNNESISSLFPSIGGSNQDKELPPMEIPTSRYWHCSECNCNAIGKTGVQLNEGIQSDGTNLGILLGHSAETSESIRSIANSAKVQQGPIAQTTDIIQSVGTSAIKLKGPTAHTTGSIRSIGTDGNENANTVDCSSVQSTQEIATAEAVETTYTVTGGQNEPTAPRKDAVDEICDEERNIESGQVITGGDTEVPTEKERTDSGNFSISAHQNQQTMPPEKDKLASVEHTDIDETNSDSYQEIDNSNGHRKRKFRKLRLLYEILYGDDSKVKKADIKSAIGSASAESAGSENVASEGQVGQGKDVANSVQSPRKRSKVNREDKETNDPSNGASNGKATKKDSGKPTTAPNAHTSDAVVTPSSGGGIVNDPNTERARHGEGLVIGPNAERMRCSEGLVSGPNTERVKRGEGLAIGPNTEQVRRGEGLVIGPNTERMRRGEGLVIGPNTERVRRGEGLVIGPNTERVRRGSDSTPSVRKKKNKHSKKLDVSVSVPSVKHLPVPSAAANLGGHPSLTDGISPGLLSGAFKSQPSHSRSDKVALDLSLGNFGKRKHNQDSGSQAFLKKDDILGESNARPTAELGRSCSKGPSWDLNERATLMSSNVEKNKSLSQRETAFLQLDRREKSSDQPNQKESDQRADDIPMDIVELLAEKQYERRNSDTGKSPIVQQRTGDTIRKFFDGEMTGTVKHLISGLPGLPSFPTASSENARTPVTLSQLSRKHLKLVQNEDTRKNMFTNLPQNQQKPSSGITISPAASGRAGLLYTGVEPLLSSTSSNPGFGLGLQQNQAAQHHKGRTISDIKQDELRKTEEARLNFAKPGGSGSGSKEKVPLDSYGNDSIPAMQLLSLMDGRSGTGFSLGSTKIHDKPFSPCGHHPRFSRGERQDFLNGSLFLRPVGTCSLRPNLSASYESLRPHSSSLSGHISFITPEKQILRGSSLMSGSSSGPGPSSVYDRDNQNPVLGGKKIIAPPQRHQRGTDSSGTILEATSLSGRVRPERTASAEGVCRTNRNPADFSVPEPGNMYTICGKDLNPRKRKPYTKKNPSGGQAPAAKKQRNNSLGKASK